MAESFFLLLFEAYRKDCVLHIPEALFHLYTTTYSTVGVLRTVQ